MRIIVSTQNIHEHNVDCIALVVQQDALNTPQIEAIARAYLPDMPALLAHRNFTGKEGSVTVLTGQRDGRLVEIVVAGLGSAPSASIPLERYRRALGRIIRSMESRTCAALLLAVPDAALFGCDAATLAEQTSVALHMASYHFDEFITDTARKVKVPELVVLMGNQELATQQSAVDKGTVIAQAVNWCRHWIDMPPSNSTPTHLADHADDVARKYDLKIKRFDEHEVINMGMGGLAGVSAGSEQDCHFVILEYRCGDDAAPTVGFVGKGITFDSGGLSIKPAASMETMKDDMSGAAAVIAAMQVIGQLKPRVNIIGFTPLSENLPSGKATKPGDILRFYNGKTAEVKNTDAEGRLVLADALSYAVKNYKLDAIIDLATLTGACAHALGPFFTGMMSQHPAFAARVQESGDRTGDRVWPLPFDNDYKAAIKSPIADICNIGSGKYRAGAITAGFFLQNFVDDVPWVHLDIAGTAFEVPDIPYYRPDGATGVGVRLLVDLAMNWQQ
ncbi:leucyl aminopeptidase [Candidatus Dependentiae bacterium]|nr:leucyl aminopeptidase [Candidatus Dependentiae bacterium]